MANPEVQFRPDDLRFYSDDEDEPMDDFVFGVPSLDHGTSSNGCGTGHAGTEESHGGGLAGPGGDGAAQRTGGGFGVPAGFIPKHRSMGLPPGVVTSPASRPENPSPSRTRPERREQVHSTKWQGRSVPLEDFKTAVVRGNMEELKTFLEQGVPVDQVMRTGWTALMYASNYANVKAVKHLLDQGADPNYHRDQYTVLMAACASTRQDQQALCDCIQLLIDHGANVNHFDRYHMSPLIYAARDNKPLVVKCLIDAGANKDKQDNRGYSALTWAACRGHTRVVHLLLEEGVDTNKACCDGSKPADLALTNGHNNRSPGNGSSVPVRGSPANRLSSPSKCSCAYCSTMTTSINIASLIRRYCKGEKKESLMQLSALSQQEKAVVDAEEEEESFSTSHTQYGALEMFLLDAELGSLITTFQENQVTFEAFLRFTDNDLQQIGIQKIGVRKKLLDSISATHKQEWLPSSLPSIQYNTLLTCPESVAMVMNLSGHASYMATSTGYVSDQIRSHPEILTKAKDGTMVLDLCNKCEEALGKVRVLYSELEMLHKVISKETSQQNFEAPDLIKVQRTSRRRQRLWLRRLGLVSTVALVGVAIWKRDSLLDTASQLFNQ